jgi:hypothetical protein
MLAQVGALQVSVPVQPTFVIGLHTVRDAKPASSKPASCSPASGAAMKFTQLPFEGAGDGGLHTAG